MLCANDGASAITKDASRLQIQQLDDDFEVKDPENMKFKGLPRPELDDAWDSLLERKLNLVASSTPILCLHPGRLTYMRVPCWRLIG